MSAGQSFGPTRSSPARQTTHEDDDDDVFHPPIRSPSKKEIDAMKTRLEELRKESPLPAQARVALERANSARRDISDAISTCHQTLAATSVHLVDFFRRIPSGELSGAIEARFKAWDLDGNGSLERNELREAMAEMGKRPTEEEIDALLDVFDTDGNGTIELEEFDQMVRINLKMMTLDSVAQQRAIARTQTL